MTKREYLESVGYEYDDWYEDIPINIFFKIYRGRDDDEYLRAAIDLDDNYYYLDPSPCFSITGQEQINLIQMAFDSLKKVYEEMQKYED